MSVHLAGGGWTEAHRGAVYGAFLREAAARAALEGAPARIVVLLVGGGAESAEHADRVSAALVAAGAEEVVVALVDEGDEFEPVALAGAHGVMVGGGLTPAYLEAVQPIADELRRLVASGSPYLGFSAGAAIAADRAIVGGWRIGEVPIGPEEIGEDLDDVTIEAGLGLVDLSVDAHAAQWGTLARLIAATEAGLVDGGVAIDEDTVLIVGETLEVRGAGSVWAAQPGEDGVIVRTLGG